VVVPVVIPVGEEAEKNVRPTLIDILAEEVLHHVPLPVGDIEAEEQAGNVALNIVEEVPDDDEAEAVEEAPLRLQGSLRNNWRRWTYSDVQKDFVLQVRSGIDSGTCDDFLKIGLPSNWQNSDTDPKQ
jgi:hypothetical protein